MITIRATDDEADLSGSADELRQVRAWIQHFARSRDRSLIIPANPNADPAPYSLSLVELHLVRDGDRTKVSIENDRSLIVSGPGENLAKFASWFDFPQDAAPGSHNHFEYLSDDQYVAHDSLPLVVSVERAQQSVAADRPKTGSG